MHSDDLFYDKKIHSLTFLYDIGKLWLISQMFLLLIMVNNQLSTGTDVKFIAAHQHYNRASWMAQFIVPSGSKLAVVGRCNYFHILD